MRRRWISRASISARRRSLRIKAIITAEEAQVLLRDPSDQNVIPVVEELRRRIAPSSATQHDGKENLSGQHDVEGAEEYGLSVGIVILVIAIACTYLICERKKLPNIK